MAKIKSFGICPYIIKENSVFILMNKSSKKSCWNFFKGKIEIEGVIDCAIREFKEETGVKIKENDLEEFFFQINKKKDIGIFLVDWSLYNKKFKFNNREIYKAKWIDIFKNFDLNVSKNQKEIYNQILTYFLCKKFWIENLIC